MPGKDKYKILVAAGGTGGHLFPAIATVQQLENQTSGNIEVKFVGTAHRIESKAIPSLGYDFHTMPVTGFAGLFSMQSWTLPYKLYKSIRICRKLIKKFKPDAVLCTGAYISYPAGAAAFNAKVPLVLMESNVNPGKTINMLSKKANLLITSFDETERYFPNLDKLKIKNLGNPVREQLFTLPDQTESRKNFGLSANIPTLLVFGGSLGALSINNAIGNILDRIAEKNIQLIWQTGKSCKIEKKIPENVVVLPFIDDMASAYAAADLVISRSGATTIAELAVCGKPSILIPLPSAANNEQAENAKIFEKENAGILLPDSDVPNRLEAMIDSLITHNSKLENMAKAAKKLAKPEAAKNAAKIILDLIDSKS